MGLNKTEKILYHKGHHNLQKILAIEWEIYQLHMWGLISKMYRVLIKLDIIKCIIFNGAQS